MIAILYWPEILMLVMVTSPILFLVALLKYRKRKGIGWLVTTVLAGIPTVFFAILVAIEGIKETVAENRSVIGGGGLTTSSNGLVRLRLPQHWKRRTDLNEEASIQAADKPSDQYLILISVPKSEISGDLEELGELGTDGLLESYSSLRRGPARKFQINGMDVVQHELTGWVGSSELAYLNTTFEGPVAYHQILCWTTRWKKAEAYEVFTEVLNSIELLSESNKNQPAVSTPGSDR